MAIIGTILFPICCVLFANNVISEFDALTSLINSHSQMTQSIADNVMIAILQAWAILFSGFFGLFGWIMIFIEYGFDKKYARYLNAIPVIGGIVCLIGLNMPSTEMGFITINSILFSTGATVLIMGVLGRLGFFKRSDEVVPT